VLFDELEKASQEVVRSLLGILENGQLTLAGGARTLDFRNSLIFMTSNVGAQQARRHRQRFAPLRWWGRGEAGVLEDALHRHFEPEFLNRIDRILMFEPIDHQWLEALLEVELGKLNQRLAAQQRSLVLDDSARAWLCRDHDARFGARALGRRLRVELEPAIAECVLREPGVGPMGATVGSDRLVVSQQATCIP
jgi:ATP-dependent Clp protease ATP-binding subunit ClpA